MKKNALKGAFRPLILFDLLLPRTETQKVKVTPQSKGRSGPTRRFAEVVFPFVCTELCLAMKGSLDCSKCRNTAASTSHTCADDPAEWTFTKGRVSREALCRCQLMCSQSHPARWALHEFRLGHAAPLTAGDTGAA